MNRCLILEYIEGTQFQENIVPSIDCLDAAVEFLELLNSDFTLASQHIDFRAAEGYLSLSLHLENIHKRIQSMEIDHLPIICQSEAKKLLESLVRQYDSISASTRSCIDLGHINDSLDPTQLCISPGDFGFHNAIFTPTGIKFIDFEFSGWDDPAKTIIDFHSASCTCIL